jgi:hypothetical protein
VSDAIAIDWIGMLGGGVCVLLMIWRLSRGTPWGSDRHDRVVNGLLAGTVVLGAVPRAVGVPIGIALDLAVIGLVLLAVTGVLLVRAART